MPLALFISPGPVVVGLPLARRLARRRAIDPTLVSDLLPFLVFGAILGARIYYVLLEWRHYRGQWGEMVAIWHGGIAIHGALIGGTLTTILFCRWRRQAFWPLLDVLLPAVALGQAIGRWGNFFNSEAFGLPTDLPWRLTIPPANRPPQFFEQATFHPTFLYESIWNLGVCGLLLVLFRQASRGRLDLRPGALSCVYLIAYSSGRFWIEGLRLDPLCLLSKPPFCSGGLRMAQLVSLVLIVVGALGLWWLYGRRLALPDPARLPS